MHHHLICWYHENLVTKEIILLSVAVLWAVLARFILQPHLQKAVCVQALCKKSSLLTHNGHPARRACAYMSLSLLK